MFPTDVTMDLAEWIINDICLILTILVVGPLIPGQTGGHYFTHVVRTFFMKKHATTYFYIILLSINCLNRSFSSRNLAEYLRFYIWRI